MVLNNQIQAQTNVASIACDASFFPRTKIGSYAIMMKINNVRTVKEVGVIPDEITVIDQSSTDCEVYAICKSIHMAITHDVKLIHLVSDSQQGINKINTALNGTVKSKNKHVRELQRWVIDKVSKKGLVISLKHVRGHQKDASRSWSSHANSVVDNMAYQYGRKLVSKKLKSLINGFFVHSCDATEMVKVLSITNSEAKKSKISKRTHLKIVDVNKSDPPVFIRIECFFEMYHKPKFQVIDTVFLKKRNK